MKYCRCEAGLAVAASWREVALPCLSPEQDGALLNRWQQVPSLAGHGDCPICLGMSCCALRQSPAHCPNRAALGNPKCRLQCQPAAPVAQDRGHGYGYEGHLPRGSAGSAAGAALLAPGRLGSHPAATAALPGERG